MGKDIDDDDWTNYSSAQYGIGDNSWSEESENKDKVDLDDLDFMEENFEVTPAPSKSGQTHLVRLGCCNYCLGRVGGVSLLNKTLFEAGKEIREAVLKSEPQLNEKEIEVCPMCEDLFEDIELITSRLSSSLSDYEFSRLQLGFQLPSDFQLLSVLPRFALRLVVIVQSYLMMPLLLHEAFEFLLMNVP